MDRDELLTLLRADYVLIGDLYLDLMTRLGEMASFDSVEAESKEIKKRSARVC